MPTIADRILEELLQKSIKELTHAEKQEGTARTNSLIRAHRYLVQVRNEAIQREIHSLNHPNKRADKRRSIALTAIGIG